MCVWCLCSLTEPLFETRCAYLEATLEQFLSWTQGDAAADVGSFCKYSKSEYWAYADYKYIEMLFRDLPSMFEVIPSIFSINIGHLLVFKGVERKPRKHILTWIGLDLLKNKSIYMQSWILYAKWICGSSVSLFVFSTPTWPLSLFYFPFLIVRVFSFNCLIQCKINYMLIQFVGMRK